MIKTMADDVPRGGIAPLPSEVGVCLQGNAFKEVLRGERITRASMQPYSQKNVLVEIVSGDKVYSLAGLLFVNANDEEKYFLKQEGESHRLPYSNLRGLSVSIESIPDIFSI